MNVKFKVVEQFHYGDDGEELVNYYYHTPEEFPAVLGRYMRDMQSISWDESTTSLDAIHFDDVCVYVCVGTNEYPLALEEYAAEQCAPTCDTCNDDDFIMPF